MSVRFDGMKNTPQEKRQNLIVFILVAMFLWSINNPKDMFLDS